MENPYRLYDRMGATAATEAIDRAIAQAIEQYPDPAQAKEAFENVVYPVLLKYRKIGAADTMSRELAREYLIRCYD